MIQFDVLEDRLAEKVASFRTAQPFEHLIVDGVLDDAKARALVAAIPPPKADQQSRDYVFARNKFEHPRFYEYGPLFAEMRDDLISDRFRRFLCELLGYEVFVDDAFVGGGIHQGGTGSYLDMHADFNRHPKNTQWVRELNILFYLNEGWQDAYGGHLDLRYAK
ncbi:MAG: hypothetical protein DIU71_13125, partial [Proteobacteria bacterium]